jgi:hypothetical protein
MIALDRAFQDRTITIDIIISFVSNVIRKNSGANKKPAKGGTSSKSRRRDWEAAMLIEDIDYALFRHPDLEASRRFMLDYGLLELERRVGAV